MQLMNNILKAVHLLALGLLCELIDCSSGGKGNEGGRESGVNSHFRKPRSKSLTDSYYDHGSSRSERPREGLRRMNVIMPSEEETAAARLEFRKNPTLEDGKGVFDDVKYRISILQVVDNGEPDLASYQFFPGSPITMDTIRRAKLQRQRDNAHKDPKLFLYADDSNSSSSSDSSDDAAGSSNGQNLRRRGNSLGTYTEKKKSKKYLKLEREWDRLREEDLKKEVELAKKKEKARRKREKERERESESKEEAKKSEKGDRKKK